MIEEKQSNTMRKLSKATLNKHSWKQTLGQKVGKAQNKIEKKNSGGEREQIKPKIFLKKQDI